MGRGFEPHGAHPRQNPIAPGAPGAGGVLCSPAAGDPVRGGRPAAPVVLPVEQGEGLADAVVQGPGLLHGPRLVADVQDEPVTVGVGAVRGGDDLPGLQERDRRRAGEGPGGQLPLVGDRLGVGQLLMGGPAGAGNESGVLVHGGTFQGEGVCPCLCM